MAMPIQSIQFGVQYTAYDKFNGAGRSACDNNTLYVYLWVLY